MRRRAAAPEGSGHCAERAASGDGPAFGAALIQTSTNRTGQGLRHRGGAASWLEESGPAADEALLAAREDAEEEAIEEELLRDTAPLVEGAEGERPEESLTAAAAFPAAEGGVGATTRLEMQSEMEDLSE